MNQTEYQRRAYLEAMGIDVWVARSESGSELTQNSLQDQPGSDLLDWPELRDCVANCTRCELSRSRRNTVFGVGDLNADWMFIGEAPGAEEDRRGEPFIGRAGKLLDEMLRAIGLSRDAVFIANMLKCRPPNNRDPKPEEVLQCRSYLERQIELVKPKIILVVGKIAAQNLLGSDESLGKLRQQRHQLSGIPLVVTYHPAYLLRSPSHKRQSWEDLCLAQRLVTEHNA
jgi:DNA polymerase